MSDTQNNKKKCTCNHHFIAIHIWSHWYRGTIGSHWYRGDGYKNKDMKTKAQFKSGYISKYQYVLGMTETKTVQMLSKFSPDIHCKTYAGLCTSCQQSLLRVLIPTLFYNPVDNPRTLVAYRFKSRPRSEAHIQILSYIPITISPNLGPWL